MQDPPYNTTACAWEWDIMKEIDEFWKEWCRVIKPNGTIIMTASQPFTTKLISSNLEMFKYEWIWSKTAGSGFVHAKNMPIKLHENVLVFSKAMIGHKTLLDENRRMRYEPVGIKSSGIKKVTQKPSTLGERKNQDGREYESMTGFPTSIITFKNDDGGFHPTQKPVSLFEFLIKTYTIEGDVVFDGFSGSFTTAISCLNTNREYICVEMDETYFKLGEERIKKWSKSVSAKANKNNIFF